MEKAKEKSPDFFKSIKTSLKSVLKHPEINTKILNDAVIKSNKIVIHTLQFLLNISSKCSWKMKRHKNSKS